MPEPTTDAAEKTQAVAPVILEIIGMIPIEWLTHLEVQLEGTEPLRAPIDFLQPAYDQLALYRATVAKLIKLFIRLPQLLNLLRSLSPTK
jgi:hypothetical protein